ncbi:MAG: prepilin-type N-terminal cleavage/methylation domain-containing protein [Candidatus Paceibacteria bacterium]|jgi:prepilin-type N-terminal cleavage/methylation domain-containing protein
MQKLRGFTLIEVLVTIAIIAILASIIFASFGGARASARNKAMTVELKEVQLALETYYSQQGKYPIPERGCGLVSGQLVARTDAGPSYCRDSFINRDKPNDPDFPLFVPEFITAIPISGDSANPDCVIEYRTANDGTWYKLTAINCLEGVDITTGVGPEEPLARCAISCSQSSAPCDPTSSDYYQSFAVYSLGGQCE